MSNGNTLEKGIFVLARLKQETVNAGLSSGNSSIQSEFAILGQGPCRGEVCEITVTPQRRPQKTVQAVHFKIPFDDGVIDRKIPVAGLQILKEMETA